MSKINTNTISEQIQWIFVISMRFYCVHLRKPLTLLLKDSIHDNTSQQFVILCFSLSSPFSNRHKDILISEEIIKINFSKDYLQHLTTNSISSGYFEILIISQPRYAISRIVCFRIYIVKINRINWMKILNKKKI